MKTIHRSGVALLTVLIYVAVAGIAGVWALKPDLLPGTAAHRAKKSTQATQRVEAATDKADAAIKAQVEEVAAGLTKIGEANATAPESPARDFIGMEVPFLLGVSPYKASPQALIAAERRRAAVMEGERDEARRLYQKEAERTEQLQRDRDRALALLATARLERERIDGELREAVAAEHVRTMQFIGAAVVAVLALAAWGYARLYSITPRSLGAIAADVRSGVNPIHALDTHLAPWLHSVVHREARLATPPQDNNP